MGWLLNLGGDCIDDCHAVFLFCLIYSCNGELSNMSYLFYLFIFLKELAEQLKAQLEKANKFKDTVTQISSKKSGVDVSSKSLFVGTLAPLNVNILIAGVSFCMCLCVCVYFLVTCF